MLAGEGATQEIHVPVEQVIAENETNGRRTDEPLSDNESLRDAARRGLRGIGEPHAQPLPATQQILEPRQILRRGYDEDVPDATEHQNGDRIIDHRLVVDREQLLAGHLRDRMQTGSGPAGQNDAFPFRSRW